MSCHTWTSHDTRERCMSHIWMSHVTHMNESCHTYEWVMSHTLQGVSLVAEAVSTVDASVGDFVKMMSDKQWVEGREGDKKAPGAYCTQFAKVCCSVSQGVAGCCRVLQCVAVCCSALQCVAVRYICNSGCMYAYFKRMNYGVATISRLLKITGRFCKRAL